MIFFASAPLLRFKDLKKHMRTASITAETRSYGASAKNADFLYLVSGSKIYTIYCVVKQKPLVDHLFSKYLICKVLSGLFDSVVRVQSDSHIPYDSIR